VRCIVPASTMPPTSTTPLAGSTRIRVAMPSGPRPRGQIANVTSVGWARRPATTVSIAAGVAGIPAIR
jgi:hypothetical protein